MSPILERAEEGVTDETEEAVEALAHIDWIDGVEDAHSDDADQSIRSDADQFGGKQRRAFSV